MFVFLLYLWIYVCVCVCVCMRARRRKLSAFGVLDGHNGFGVGRGRRGRRFGHGRGGRVQLLLLLVVQVVLMGGRRLEHYRRTAAAAERARMVRRGRRVLVERPVQLLVSRVSGRERRHGHGWRPPVGRSSGGRRRRFMPLMVRRPLLRRWRTAGRLVHRGRGRGRGVGRVLAGHVGQRPYARLGRAALCRQQATAAAAAAGGRRRH